MAQVKWKPEGLNSVMPSLTLEGCAEAIAAYQKVFGAVENSRAPDPSGKKIWHADITIGDSHLFLNDYLPNAGVGKPGPLSLWVYLEDADQAFERAKSAGWKVTMPMQEMFWGDRTGSVTDRWGNNWTIAKHVKDMTQDEMKRAGEEFAKKMKR
ncbi:MAG: VOC family protein [Myxococcales bacterium]